MKQSIMRLCQWLFTVSVIIALIVVASYSITRKTSASSSGGIKNLSVNSKKAAVQAAAKTSYMNSVATTIAQYPSVQTGVSLIDLDSDTQTDMGETAGFAAASTTKVLTASAYMHEADEGRASLDTVISGSSAQDLLQRMLNVSDNDAWAALNDYIGKATLQSYAQGLGLTSYDPYNNIITAHDEALLFSKLYNHQITSASNTNLLFSFMQDTNNEDLIPAALPNAATVYHKYGYLDGELHDAAIVSYQGRHFALVIFTKSDDNTLNDYTTRTQLFHALVKNTLTYVSAV